MAQPQREDAACSSSKAPYGCPKRGRGRHRTAAPKHVAPRMAPVLGKSGRVPVRAAPDGVRCATKLRHVPAGDLRKGRAAHRALPRERDGTHVCSPGRGLGRRRRRQQRHDPTHRALPRASGVDGAHGAARVSEGPPLGNTRQRTCLVGVVAGVPRGARGYRRRGRPGSVRPLARAGPEPLQRLRRKRLGILPRGPAPRGLRHGVPVHRAAGRWGAPGHNHIRLRRAAARRGRGARRPPGAGRGRGPDFVRSGVRLRPARRRERARPAALDLRAALRARRAPAGDGLPRRRGVRLGAGLQARRRRGGRAADPTEAAPLRRRRPRAQPETTGGPLGRRAGEVRPRGLRGGRAAARRRRRRGDAGRRGRGRQARLQPDVVALRRREELPPGPRV